MFDKPTFRHMLDLHSRKIIGFSAGRHKDAALVRSAFASIRGNLFDIQVCHTDRGSEFDNRLIDDILDAFEQLRLELADYVHWFNCIRLHGTLGYLSPDEFQKANTLSFLSE